MKAAILYEANTPLRVVEVEQQRPQPGEARVRVKAVSRTYTLEEINQGFEALTSGQVARGAVVFN